MAHLFETHLSVKDIDSSIAFYRDVVGLELAHVAPTRGAAFLWIGGRGHSMLGLWSLGSSPNNMKLHVAIALELSAVLASVASLKAAGIQPLDFHGNPTVEPSVIAWMPAASIFFRDLDGNLLEYLAMLPDEPQPTIGISTFSQWQAMRAAP
jgi:lactoylglutathione lyase